MKQLSESNARAAREQLDEVAQNDSLRGVTSSDFRLLKAHLLSDSFDFTKFFCQYPILTDQFHRPLSYVASHSTDKLVALLNRDDFDSYVLSALKADLIVRKIDWNTPDGYTRFDELLDFVNFRLYRGGGKSSVITHGGLVYEITRDPNSVIALMSVNDEGARSFCRQVRETLQTDRYQMFFPERIPPGDLTKLWSESKIWIGGRTISAKEATIEARGFTSAWARTHFNKFWCDDVTTDSNCGDADLRVMARNMANMDGLYMPKCRVWRRHVGTVWAEADDHSILKKIEDCVSIVVPIEVYANGTPEDMTVRGKPTNPEWHDVKEVQAKFRRVTSDDNEGPLGWKRNFWLDPTAASGDRMMPPSVVDGARYRFGKVGNDFRFVREKRDDDWKIVPRKDPKTGRPIAKRDAAGELIKVNDEIQYEPDYESFKRSDLFIVLGVDPAYSETGDDWAITALGTDYQDCSYQLETRAAKGYGALLENLSIMLNLYQPRLVGYEKAGAQEESFKTTLQYDKRFRRWARLFYPVSHKNDGKAWRIANRVAEPLKMRKLLLNPVDKATREEMVSYVPGPKAVDNRLDSIAISMSIARKAKAGGGDWRKALEERQRRLDSRRDPITRVRIT